MVCLDQEVSLDCLVLLEAGVKQVFLDQQDLLVHLAVKDHKVNVVYPDREVNQDYEEILVFPALQVCANNITFISVYYHIT